MQELLEPFVQQPLTIPFTLGIFELQNVCSFKRQRLCSSALRCRARQEKMELVAYEKIPNNNETVNIEARKTGAPYSSPCACLVVAAYVSR